MAPTISLQPNRLKLAITPTLELTKSPAILNMSERHHDTLHGRLETLTLEDSAHDDYSTSESEAESPSYLLCNSRGSLERVTSMLKALTEGPHPWQKPHIFLCCEGRYLGRGEGRLGLIQLGIKDDIFLLDVLTYGKSLEVVKEILENPEVDKIMWNGRFGVAELWHDHEISVKSVLDLQLVHVYEKTGGRIAARGFLPAEAMESAFLNLETDVYESTGMDMKAFHRRQEEIQRKQHNDNDYWLRRPMTLSSLDYSSFKIVQLCTLYSKYLDAISKYPHIAVESQRYAEIYNDERPPPNAWFIDHDILQQEILERSPDIQERYDPLGTRDCAGCRRSLHQDSFKDSFARRWTLRLGEHGRMCYTCQEARRSNDHRNSPNRWAQS